jgi:hypothetical protein
MFNSSIWDFNVGFFEAFDLDLVLLIIIFLYKKTKVLPIL